MNQKKAGAILSYIRTFLYSLMNVVMIPFFIYCLGKNQYGIYKIITSFAGYLFIMDFGVGTITTRYVSLYRKNNNKERIDACMATIIVVCIMISVIVATVGAVMYLRIDNIYSSLNSEEIKLAKDMFLILIVNVIVLINSHVFTGYASAYEKFIATGALSVGTIILRVFMLIVLLSLGCGARAIVSTDFIISCITGLSMMIYGYSRLNLRISLKRFDKTLLSGYFIFSSAVLFQSIVNQINGSLDNLILGVMTTPTLVAIYSSGTTLFGLYIGLPETIKNIFLPQATMLFGDGSKRDDGKALTDFVIRPGRYNTMICMLILTGFVTVGRDFIIVWLGRDFMDAWIIALILMVPATLPSCENIMNTILNAKNKRLFQSCVLCGVAVINIVLTVIFVKHEGYIWAAVATGISYMLGHNIILNIYYRKCFGLQICRLIKGLFKGILPCALITMLACAPLNFITIYNWGMLIVKAGAVCMVFFVSLCLLGFNKDEKNIIFGFIKKIEKRKS